MLASKHSVFCSRAIPAVSASWPSSGAAWRAFISVSRSRRARRRLSGLGSERIHRHDRTRRRLLCFSLFWHALDIIRVALLTLVYLVTLIVSGSLWIMAKSQREHAADVRHHGDAAVSTRLWLHTYSAGLAEPGDCQSRRCARSALDALKASPIKRPRAHSTVRKVHMLPPKTARRIRRSTFKIVSMELTDLLNENAET